MIPRQRTYEVLRPREEIMKDPINTPPRSSSLDHVRCLAEMTKDLRDDHGNLCAKRTARLFGVRPSRLAHWLGQAPTVTARHPSASCLQNGLQYFEKIAWLRAVLTDKAFRKWLRSPNPNLGNETPMHWLDDGKLQSIVDLVHDMLTGAPT